MNIVISKLSYNQEFTFYRKGDARSPAVRESGIVIQGGANVRDPHTFVLPDCVQTQVSDEVLAKLESHPLFKQYIANGMMKVVKGAKEVNKAKHDMPDKDGSAQLTEQDYKERGIEPPKPVEKPDGGDAE